MNSRRRIELLTAIVLLGCAGSSSLAVSEGTAPIVPPAQQPTLPSPITGTARIYVQAVGGGPASGAELRFVGHGTRGSIVTSLQADEGGVIFANLEADPTVYRIIAAGANGGRGWWETVLKPGTNPPFGLALTDDWDYGAPWSWAGTGVYRGYGLGGRFWHNRFGHLGMRRGGRHWRSGDGHSHDGHDGHGAGAGHKANGDGSKSGAGKRLDVGGKGSSAGKADRPQPVERSRHVE